MKTEEIVGKIGEYWDEYAHKFDAEHDTEDLEVWRATLEACLGTKNSSTILDLGSGTGFLANMAAEMGHFCIGLDIADKMLDIAVRKAAAQKLKAVYMRGDVLDLPFTENTFDFIINARLLWTLVEPGQAVSHWVRLIKPGGKLLCFNRFKEGLGLCGGLKVYEDKNVDEAVVLADASSDELLKLFADSRLTDVEFRRLPDGLTKPDHAAGYDPWHVLIGTRRI